jgi:hypothetical protein
VQPDRLKLYVNKKLAGSAPGVRMPRGFTPPRAGQPATNWRGVPVTRFRDKLDKKERVAPFEGRLDDFLMVNDLQVQEAE